jgi:DNA-directed RNA polymerase specialized sigma24 family protein
MRTGSGDDAEDWAAAGGGDGEAYGRVFDRHRDRVHRHALRLVPPDVDVDDVVAVVFLEAWRRRRSARLVDGDLLPWLLAIGVAAESSQADSRCGAVELGQVDALWQAEHPDAPEFSTAAGAPYDPAADPRYAGER